MAPEVLSNTLDLRDFGKLKCADIYSFALVMWEIGYRTDVGGKTVVVFFFVMKEFWKFLLFF